MPLELEQKTATKKVLKKKVVKKATASGQGDSEPATKKKVVKKAVKAAAKTTKPTTKTKARKAKTKKAVSKSKPPKVAKKKVAKKKVAKKKVVKKAGKTAKAHKAAKKDVNGGLIGGRSKNKGIEGQRQNGWGANWDIYELFSKKFFTEEEALEELKDKKAFKGKGKKRNLATIHRILGGMRRQAYSQYEDYTVEERAGNKYKVVEL